MKINFNIDDELLKKVDDFAAEKYINRTAAICVLISSALQANDIQNAVVKMGNMKEMFEEFERLELNSK